MNWDDTIYLFALAFSIFFGHVYRKAKNLEMKKWIGTSIGCIIVILLTGFNILHLLTISILNILILRFTSRRLCHVISFVVSFAYLLFFRLCHYTGLPMTTGHANAIQMIITLKLVGLCFEVHDTWIKTGQLKKVNDEEKQKQLEMELKFEGIDPTDLDILHYSFCYIGILTGPYFKYRVYVDMLQECNGSMNINYFSAMLNRIRVVPLYALMFLVSTYYFPLSFAESEEIFTSYSFFYRIWYMTPIFFSFRMRIYTGFVLAECVCIMAGLGAYPETCEPRSGRGPTKFKALECGSIDKCVDYNFKTIHNIDEWGSEFSPTVRGGIRSWNMTVQYWLANNIYRRLPLPKPIKEAITMLTSAFWHGVHSGYYLSMLTVPFILVVEDYYERIIRRKLSNTGQRVYDWFSWILKMQHFAYMGMAFLLLRVDVTVHYWRSIGFYSHGLIVLMHAFAQYINLIYGKAEKKLQKIRETEVYGDTKLRVTGTQKGVDPNLYH